MIRCVILRIISNRMKGCDVTMRTERKDFLETTKEKRIEFQHMEERQKRLWKLLERSCFAVFGIVWTATGVLAAVYGLGPYALLAFLPAAGFWAMLFSGYTAPLSIYDADPPILTHEERERLMDKIDKLG